MADKKRKKKSQLEMAKDLVRSVLGKGTSADTKPERDADRFATSEGSAANKLKKQREKRKKMLDEI